MPRDFLPFLFRLVLFVALAACVLGSPLCGMAEDPPPASEQLVEVKFWVIEISTTKLRNLGFDWNAIHGSSKLTDDAKVLDFLTALDQNGLAHTLAKPMIATRNGRKASLEIGPHLKVEVTPTVATDEHIALAYHVEVATVSDAQRNKTGRHLVSACSTELKSGVVQLLSETTTRQRTVKGEPSQTTLLVLAQAATIE